MYMFVSFHEAVCLIKSHITFQYSETELVELLEYFSEVGLLTTLKDDEKSFFLREDIIRKLDCILRNLEIKFTSNDVEDVVNFLQRIVFLRGNTFVLIVNNEMVNYEYALLNNLSLLSEDSFISDIKKTTVKLMGLTIITDSSAINNYVLSIVSSNQEISNNRSSKFYNTAHYMGNKNSILEFLLAAINFHKKAGTSMLDLMCGSGAVSNALSNVDAVYASDAQEFCTLLAHVQGKPAFNIVADEVLAQIRYNYENNFNCLKSYFKNQLSIENKLFHMDYDTRKNKENQDLYDAYIGYSESLANAVTVPSCEDNINSEYFNILSERKNDNRAFPYCLFSLYFANVYFGLRQSIQIDSLRYAIDKVDNEDIRNWLLGALIITCSVLGTSYGGHFAQPIKVTAQNVAKIIERHQKSIVQEFSKRFITLIKIGKTHRKAVVRIKGPWKDAITHFQTEDNVFVYLDAPYKREEYSRYYHLLETLVLYNYPSCTGKGRISSKQKGERFYSEFFTHSKEKIDNLFFTIIKQILSKGWSCAWSYSDNGKASIISIIEQIKAACECDIFLYSTPHQHINQGVASKKSGRRSVREYLVIFKTKY